MRSLLKLIWGIVLLATLQIHAADSHLANTALLTTQGDLSAQMVSGIDRFLMHAIEQSISNRSALWHRDFSSTPVYEHSVETNRQRFRTRIGAVDPRIPITSLEYVGSVELPARVAETDSYTIDAVRWPVFAGVHGEGLLVRPKANPTTFIVAIPDADQTPEMVMGLTPGLPADRQFARRLAETGCTLLIPVLISREDTFSGNARLRRFTNQPHREWIYRQAYELGRHVIGYEVQKILGAIDWLEKQAGAAGRPPRIGVAGYGEGGLIAFYAAALDQRISGGIL